MGCTSSGAKEPMPALPAQTIMGSPNQSKQDQAGVKQVSMDVIWFRSDIRLEREDGSKYRWKLLVPFKAKEPCELAVDFHCTEEVKNGFCFSRVKGDESEKDSLPSAYTKSYDVGEHVVELAGEFAIDLQKCPLEIFWKYKRLGQEIESSVYPIVLSLSNTAGGMQSVLYCALTMDALNEGGVPMRLGEKHKTAEEHNGDTKYYCGRTLGVERIPGSDGTCGPLNGPQCEDCQKAQAKLQQSTRDSQRVDQLKCMLLLQKIFTRGQSYVVNEMYGLTDMAKQVTQAGEESEGELCVICLSEPRTTAVMPCRHLCCCEDCTVELRLQGALCPICRGPVQSTTSFRLDGTGPTKAGNSGKSLDKAWKMPATEEEERKKWLRDNPQRPDAGDMRVGGAEAFASAGAMI